MDETAPQGRRPPPPIPIAILTGFLGAGKTTLLNRLLRSEALADTLVIVNEFGEVGLDHLLMESARDDLILLGAGCLCCTVRGDLVATLEDLLRRRDNGRVTPFRRVVIETTGLADPAPVMNAVLNHPYLRMRYALDGIVTVVDAVNGAETLDAHEEARRQVAVADRIVLTKTDLGADTAALVARIQALNPGAPLADAARGEAGPALLAGSGLYRVEDRGPDVLAWLRADAVAGHDHHGHDHHRHDHHHDHGHDHHHGGGHSHDDHGHGHPAHDVNRHDARIRAYCLTADTPVDPRALDLFLDMLRAAHGPKLLRLKGLVALADDPARPVVLHAVQHVLHPPVRLEAWPDADTRTRLVFILQDLDRHFVDSLWGAFTGRPSIDAPDAAALMDNPLSLRGG